MLKQFIAPKYSGYSLQFSPFFEHKLAVVGAANYGLIGNGQLLILEDTPGDIVVQNSFETQDGLFDISWSEINEHQLITACGDGSIKLWDINLKNHPIRNWQEHKKEVMGVNWNPIKKDLFCSASWDQTIKIWNPEVGNSLTTLPGHQQCVYSAMWSPHNPDLLASCSGDQQLKVWDTRNPNQAAHSIHAHLNEILSLDWNKYEPSQVVTASVDHTVKAWDLRDLRRELVSHKCHDYAIRRVKCSPHANGVIGTASYDMTARLWDLNRLQRGNNPALYVHDVHSEFVLGLDFNLYVPGQVATCSWDEKINLFVVPELAKQG
ncbi:WD40 repeat-like protein [Conidiobolus coronatus NRRL 28638]|uniref:Peroxin-7 n=1 Tax=Conidiobolus coronatus (strain ATCC 28846 / CBS 209.66 / NRRL 28638) TaxID=796925 RepID=A0A137PAV7_CONC2|nr:WD40 repeat-like protein [Conidiobolus coronatus NRRL 28638]|eukprot:KXN72150.1 WD40 repeat-like protein [Conidiobolus coronatus NRRL 28638]